MSYSLVHLVTPHCSIRKKRGLLVYKQGDQEKNLPIEDIRGVVIATKSVSLSDNLICSLVNNGAFILHCDDQYKPLGITAPLDRIVNAETLNHQVFASAKLKNQIWKLLLQEKVQKQINQLQFMQSQHEYLQTQLNKKI